MRRTLILAIRELRSALDTPVLYVLSAAQSIFAAAWLYFVREFFVSGVADLRDYFAILPFIAAFTGSALGMKYWAEERKTGTFEMLAILPVSFQTLVAGKYLGAVFIMLLSFLPCIGVPVAAGMLGNFDPGIVAANFLALFLLSLSLMAVSQWASSFASSQIQAFLLSACMVLFLLLADKLAAYAFPRGVLADAAAWLSMARHFTAFAGGAADTEDVVYFLAIAAFFLVPTVRNVERRR